ncbi:MAG: hypothetical protein ABGW98_16330 [Myxococcales bacterium]|nr:hypothetical protein [Myxococcales bacterium]
MVLPRNNPYLPSDRKKSNANEAIAPNSLIELSKFDINNGNVVGFPPYRLDLDRGKLWRSGSEFKLDMKARTQPESRAFQGRDHGSRLKEPAGRGAPRWRHFRSKN